MRLYTLTTYIGIIGGGGLKAFLRQAKVVRLIFDLRVGRSILLVSPNIFFQIDGSDARFRDSILTCNALEIEMKDIDRGRHFSIFMGNQQSFCFSSLIRIVVSWVMLFTLMISYTLTNFSKNCHIFPSTSVTTNKNLHNVPHCFLAQYFMPPSPHMLWSVFKSFWCF